LAPEGERVPGRAGELVVEVNMKKLVTGMAVLGALLLAGQVYGQMGGMMGRGGMMRMSMIRHRYVMMQGISPEYASKTDPVPVTAATLKAGKILYNRYCASCHGVSGLGNGPAGANLNPPPANISQIGKIPMATDGYLYWTLAEGGVPLGTSMPAFKSTLKAKQIWEIINYIRNF
jgi:mono/diheme cytochrome c family protein